MAADTDTSALPAPTTNRRTFFSVTALLGVATGVPGTAPPASAAAPALAAAVDVDGNAYTEADLIAFCAEWREAIDEYMPLVTRLDRVAEKDQPATDRARCDALDDDIHELEQIIFSTPAATLAGLKAKAGVLAFMGNEMGMPVDSPAAWSLVKDILALGRA